MKHFGTDGVRGIANVKLTPEMAYRIGRFIGQYPEGKKNKILLARDTRISGDMLRHALVAGILASGSDVYDEGVSTTPSISYLVQNGDFDYGIMISASHNPYYDNGIKLFNKDGEKISSDIESDIEQYMDSPVDNIPHKINDEIGRCYSGKHLLEKYIDFLVSKAKDLKSMKVLVDCANGSASVVAPTLFNRLGINATFMNANPNGTNINDRCGSTHLDGLIKAIKNDQYDIGLAFDGDSDRFMAVTPNGAVIDGDAVLYLNALYLQKHNALDNNTIVITSMSNLGLKKALEKHNISLEVTDVGDKYVQARLKERCLDLGGEQSGHIIFLKDLNTGDGLLTAIKIMNILVDEKRPVEELLEGLTIYPQLLKNVAVLNKVAILHHSGLNDFIKELQDSLKDEGRIIVRPSGTEPLVRVMCEAKSMSICESIVNQIVDYIDSINY